MKSKYKYIYRRTILSEYKSNEIKKNKSNLTKNKELFGYLDTRISGSFQIICHKSEEN